MKQRFPKINTEYTKFNGGLDLESPPLSVYPGSLLSCLNYECGTNGGYRRIDGYERYDGRFSPSDANYYYCEATYSATLNVGDIVTGVTSGATGEVIIVESTHFNITKVTGTFQSEVVNVGGSPVATITNVPSMNAESTGLGDATAKAAAADVYRDDILKPSGSNPIRGLQLLNGTLYAFVDNSGGTAGEIYKATSSGWVNVSLFNEISFNTGISEISDGDSINQLVSGATADVKRVVVESGTWSGGDAAGRLILDNISGTFDATNIIRVGTTNSATSTSLATAITISPGGRYVTMEKNFSGSLDNKRIYGVDGINRAFEFDGETYVPITSGIVPDTPKHMYVHKQQLFLSFKSSSQNSGVGNPYQFTPITGASEIALGDNITGYQQLPGKALAIFARNLSKQLIGDNVSNFALDPISDEVGAIPYTQQRIGDVYALDDRGIVAVSQTDKFGNFSQSTVSRRVQPIIDTLRKVVVASTVYRSRDQYRLYGSDGTGVIMTVLDNFEGLVFSNFEYPDNIICATSGEDSTGKDVVFLGDDSGWVYQADKGSSFDGEKIESFLQLHFNNLRSPTVLKGFKKMVVELTAESYTSLRYSPEFSYADPDRPAHREEVISSQGAGGYWDAANWDEFFYDSKIVNTPEIRIDGSGTNIGIIIYGNSKIDFGHKIDGVVVHYILRRLVR